MRFGAGPSCWQCGGLLAKLSDGSPIFVIYTDPIGNPHRVHKTCGKRLDANKPLTARDPDHIELEEMLVRLDDA